jgi:V/A-type H+/Na+-transporting ATPase subunit E
MTEEAPLRGVLDRIVDESKGRIEKIRNEAISSAEHLIGTQAAADRTKHDSEIEAARERLDSELAQELSSARLRSRKSNLEARRMVMDELRESILSQLTGMPMDERRKLVMGLLQQASSVIPQGTVRCGEMDEPILREFGRYGIAGRIGPPGGIVVQDTTGERVLDLRFATMVDLAMESLSEDLEDVLFGG